MTAPEIRTRQQLIADLARAVAPGSDEQLFVVYRLGGLNDLATTASQDSFMRVALTRAHDLIGDDGRLYSPRRDEFCALFACPLGRALDHLDHLTPALSKLARPFGITVDSGIALLPDGLQEPFAALQRADQRLSTSGDADPDPFGYGRTDAAPPQQKTPTRQASQPGSDFDHPKLLRLLLYRSR